MSSDAHKKHGVLPSPKGQGTHVDVANVFKQYDKNKTGAIEIDELRDFMSHLGLLNGRSPAESNAVVVSAFATADTDRDNALNLAEFTAYYNRATAPRLGDLLKADHPEDMIALRLAFNNWASFGSSNSSSTPSGSITPGAASRVQLGSAHWLKLCRDTGLVGRGALNSTDADLIFAKVKPRGLQKINFTHFVDALGAVATRLNRELLDVVRLVTTSQGPVVNASNTKATSNINHQQQQRRSSAPTLAPLPSSSISQSHSRPGSAKEKLLLDNTSNNNTSTVAADPRTSITDGDGFKIAAHRSDTSSQGRPHSGIGGSGRGSSAHNSENNDDGDGLTGNIEQVLLVFGEFAGFGAGSSKRSSTGNTASLRTSSTTPFSNNATCDQAPSPMKMEMDSKQFLKLCKDSGLVTNPATAVAADLCFAKAKSRGARRLSFADFLVALALLAQEKKCAEGEVLARVAACTGPRRTSTTTPEYTRLALKETFTGVYARGGPKTVDDGAPDLAKLLSREQGRRI